MKTNKPTESSVPKPVYGIDYDGWALPLERDGGPPYWSHFVGSPVKPLMPKGCVMVKITAAQRNDP